MVSKESRQEIRAKKHRKIRNRFFEVFEKLGDSENIKIVNAAREIPEVLADIIKIYDSIKEK